MIHQDRTPTLNRSLPLAGELLSSHNLLFLEDMYEDFVRDPATLAPQWRAYFEMMLQGEQAAPSSHQVANGSTTHKNVSNGNTANGHTTHSIAANGHTTHSIAAQERVAVPSLQAGNGQSAGLRAAQMGPADPSAWEQEDTRTFARIASAPFSARAMEPAQITRESRMDLPAPLTGWVERLGFLRNFQLFRNMEQDDLAQIASVVRERQFAAQEYLCREGELGEAVFIVVSGQVKVQRQGRFVVELGPGEVVGELSVLDNSPRSADVVAITPLHVLELRGDDFQQLLAGNSKIMRGLLQVLVARMRETSDRQERVAQLVRAYREKGHAVAELDPLGLRNHHGHGHPELTITHYGLDDGDLDTRFSMRIGREVTYVPLRQILSHLRRIYCGAIGVQYMHIDNLYIQEWLRERMEDPIHHRPLDRNKQLRILTKLTDAEMLETFLHKKFLGAKRFSLEGAESLIPLLDEAIEKAGEYGVSEVVIGMAHRGRLNVLANTLQKPTSQIFREFEDIDPDFHTGGGDVKYHLGYSNDRQTANGQEVHLSLCFNPSHLEAVGPVVLGRTRAKQDRIGDVERGKILPIIIHGDASFIGQGVVQEIFNMSELPGYTVGGTVHIIVNNQIGFTTPPEESRSSEYATDIARMLQIPIFHVNGENPEAVDRVIQIAMDFHHTFKKDVVIDMFCYRRHGHNEGDEPAFTQPLLYDTIANQKSVRQAYIENLLKLGEINEAETEEIAERSRMQLEAELAMARSPEYTYAPVASGGGRWSDYCGGADSSVPPADTSVPIEKLQEYLNAMTRLPQDFNAHRKISRHFKSLQAMAKGEQPLNWGAAESLAFASLLVEGAPIRITGQDSERGTFTHRHAVIHDVQNGQTYTPLQHLSEQQAPLQLYNSSLSEYGVLGFEYGFSLDVPEGLTVWEAQFGDFCNTAQVIFDQFITSSEAKWNRLTGLCVLLPHGFEGQGPEHSSARLERFLTLAAKDNIQVVNLTTPAQFFHCLRRQIHRPIRKPLIVMSPKSLLRHKMATSTLEELSTGRFYRLLHDTNPKVTPENTKKLLLCSGKIYYELEQERSSRGIEDVALLRLEQYYPFPLAMLQKTLLKYPKGTPFVWVQEEPENMGAWPFLCRQLYPHFRVGSHYPLSCIARPEGASPATGSKACHDIEQANLINRALSLST